MVSTDSVSAASGHAPDSGNAPRAAPKTRKERRDTERQRPSHAELTVSLNKVLQDDSDMMKEALKSGRVLGGVACGSIIDKLMAAMPKVYPWKPTVPPCLAGWIPPQNDT